jgi:dipeptidyl aminopeptidase/acylaminoacyl peptidase
VHGDVHPINRINHEIVIPELRRAGKDLTVIAFPGEKHGFSHRGTPEARLKFFQEADQFFRQHLAMPTNHRAVLTAY